MLAASCAAARDAKCGRWRRETWEATYLSAVQTQVRLRQPGARERTGASWLLLLSAFAHGAANNCRRTCCEIRTESHAAALQGCTEDYTERALRTVRGSGSCLREENPNPTHKARKSGMRVLGLDGAALLCHSNRDGLN